MVGFEPQVLTQTFWCGGDFDLEERLARRKEQSRIEMNREDKKVEERRGKEKERTNSKNIEGNREENI